jgi:hypothetical protein
VIVGRIRRQDGVWISVVIERRIFELECFIIRLPRVRIAPELNYERQQILQVS